MKAWNELRVNIAAYLSEVRHGAMTYEQQSRLAMAWPTIYLMGKGGGCSSESWRNALGYTHDEWMQVRERYALVLDRGEDVWALGFLSDEVARQKDHSRKQSERVSKRWNTTVHHGKTRNTSEYLAVAVEPKEESTPALWLESSGGERWEPSVGQVRDWKVAHPGVDIAGEFAKMRGWLSANPTKAKTMRGLPRFANGWLQRAVASAKPTVQVSNDEGVWGLEPKRGR